MIERITPTHLEWDAYAYVRQSAAAQVHEDVESKQRQRALAERTAQWAGYRPRRRSSMKTKGRVGHGYHNAHLRPSLHLLARTGVWQRGVSKRNTKMPIQQYAGQPPDEMFLAAGPKVPDELVLAQSMRMPLVDRDPVALHLSCGEVAGLGEGGEIEVMNA